MKEIFINKKLEIKPGTYPEKRKGLSKHSHSPFLQKSAFKATLNFNDNKIEVLSCFIIFLKNK